MKIDCTIVLKNLAGEEIADATFGKILANILSASQTKGAMKLYALAISLFQQDSVDVDKADLTLIKREVEATTAYTTLIKGQCELLLEDVK